MSLYTAPTLPMSAGPAGLLRFAASERSTRRPIEQVRALFQENPSTLTTHELGVVLFYSYVIPTRLGRLKPVPPLVAAPREDWVRWFCRVGYLHSGFRLPMMRAKHPQRLYRAGLPKHARGLSWTPHLATAEYYARRRSREIATERDRAGKPWRASRVRIFEVDAKPSWLLAYNPAHTGVGMHGAEWVIDVPDSALIRRVERRPSRLDNPPRRSARHLRGETSQRASIPTTHDASD